METMVKTYLIMSDFHSRVAFLVPASKSISDTRAAVTFSRHRGRRKRGRGPLKKLLKVGDKNKPRERRKLIIHNRQFTWMSTYRGSREETKAAFLRDGKR